MTKNSISISFSPVKDKQGNYTIKVGVQGQVDLNNLDYDSREDFLTLIAGLYGLFLSSEDNADTKWFGSFIRRFSDFDDVIQSGDTVNNKEGSVTLKSNKGTVINFQKFASRFRKDYPGIKLNQEFEDDYL